MTLPTANHVDIIATKLSKRILDGDVPSAREIEGLKDRDGDEKQKALALKVVKVLAKVIAKNAEPKHVSSFIENICDANMLNPVAEIFGSVAGVFNAVPDAANTAMSIASTVLDPSDAIASFADPTGISAAVSIIGIAAKTSVLLLRAAEKNIENPTLAKFVGALADAGALVETVTDIAKNFTVPGIFFTIANQVGSFVQDDERDGKTTSVQEKFANALQDFFGPEEHKKYSAAVEKYTPKMIDEAIEAAMKNAAKKFEKESAEQNRSAESARGA